MLAISLARPVEGFHTEYIRFDVTSNDEDQTKGFTFRYVDINDLLLGVMTEWLGAHPGGPRMLCFPDGRALLVQEVAGGEVSSEIVDI